MSRYIDADKLQETYKELHDGKRSLLIDTEPTADVRENVIAHKVIGGGEHDGATCWFECSRCGKTVDVNDKYCSECGARFKGGKNERLNQQTGGD